MEWTPALVREPDVQEAATEPRERTGSEGPGTFEAFFEAEHVRLFRALFLIAGSAHEAEELSQEAFLKVWERWDRVKAMEAPVGYLYRTAMNVFRSRYRRAVRAAKHAARVRQPRDRTDPMAVVDERDAAVRALRTLSPRQRAALVLTEMIGYRSEEAGRLLGVKATTVRVLASQGRAALRMTMEPDDE
jgi:RNA polymerase sigma-70 factor (ECF subfamily)